MTWHLVYTAPRTYEIQGIAAPSKSQAWAFGTVYGAANAVVRHFYRHWNGRSWQRASVPAAAGIFLGHPGIVGLERVDLRGQRCHRDGRRGVYNGQGWTAMSAPMGVESELVVSSTDVWVTTSVGTTTVATHWNGSGWQPCTVAGQLDLAGGGSRPWLVGVSESGSVRACSQPGGCRPLERQPMAADQRAGPYGRASGRRRRSRRQAVAGDAGAPQRQMAAVSASWPLLAPARDAAQLRSRHKPHDLPAVYDGHNGFWSPPYHWTGSRWVNTAPGMPLKPRWLNTFWYNNVAPVPGTSSSGPWCSPTRPTAQPAAASRATGRRHKRAESANLLSSRQAGAEK